MFSWAQNSKLNHFSSISKNSNFRVLQTCFNRLSRLLSTFSLSKTTILALDFYRSIYTEDKSWEVNWRREIYSYTKRIFIKWLSKQRYKDKSISKSLSKSHSLNHHLVSHLHKNRFLYLFTLQQFFYISYAL